MYSGEFVESSAVKNQFIGNTSSYYTPSTGTNSCMNMGKWMIPEGAVAGDVYHIIATVVFSGFDSSSTAGTFRMLFQGANYTSPTSSAWQGANAVCSALNNYRNLTTTVLSATSGTYLYETSFTLTADFLSTYYGSNIGTRSDYSNGTGSITIKDIRIIPEKYATTVTPPQNKCTYWRFLRHCKRIYRMVNAISERRCA